ncbi:MAG: 2-keto-4-methylthiobutyrate aminotransferase, partial [Acetobacter sp.]
MTFVWLNGALCPRDKARISPADRGFTLGDGVFETMRVVGGGGGGVRPPPPPPRGGGGGGVGRPRAARRGGGGGAT